MNITNRLGDVSRLISERPNLSREELGNIPAITEMFSPCFLHSKINKSSPFDGQSSELVELFSSKSSFIPFVKEESSSGRSQPYGLLTPLKTPERSLSLREDASLSPNGLLRIFISHPKPVMMRRLSRSRDNLEKTVTFVLKQNEVERVDSPHGLPRAGSFESRLI